MFLVTETAAKQRRAPITRLTWDDLKILSHTSLSLTELYKLKDLSSNNQHFEEHASNNLNTGDTFLTNESNTLNVQELENEASDFCGLSETASKGSIGIPEEELLEKVPIVDALQPEVVEEPTEMYETKTDAKTTKMQDQTYISTKTLAAYMEMCSVLKNPNRGLIALRFHKHRVGKGKNSAFRSIKQIRVYNAVLKGFASKGDIGKLEEVIKMIRDEQIKLNIQSYLAILECYGRNNVQEHCLKQIRIYVEEAKNNGFTCDMLLSKGKFLNDEREVVLKAIRSCDQNYIPKYFKPMVQYDNSLVNELNDPEQLIPLNTITAKKNKGLFTEETMKMAIKQQLQLEKEGSLLVKNVNHQKITDDVLKVRKMLSEHYKNWEETATKAFIRDLSALTAQRNPLSDEPFMRCIPVKDFVTIIVDEAKKLSEGSETFSPIMSILHREIGRKVYMRYLLLRKQKSGVLDKITEIHSKYCTLYADEHQQLDVLPSNCNFVNSRQKWQWVEHSVIDTGASFSMEHCNWIPPTLYTIGKFLYRIILHDLKIDVNVMKNTSTKPNMLPAFYTIFRTQGRIIKEEVKPHPVLSRLYRESTPETLTFLPNEVPMLCPPVPWTSANNGGYLATSCSLARISSIATIQQKLLTESGLQLYPALDALNQLGAVPWKVNTKIFDIILEVFNKGGSNELNVPINPSSVPPLKPPTQNMDKTQKYHFFKEKLRHQRQLAELYSLWCDCLYRLSLGNHVSYFNVIIFNMF